MKNLNTDALAGKRILFISSIFFPQANSGLKRILQTCLALEKSGHQVTILSKKINPEYYKKLNFSLDTHTEQVLLKDSSIKVRRGFSFESWYYFFKILLKKKKPNASVSSFKKNTDAFTWGDTAALWSLPAVLSSISIKTDLVYATSPSPWNLIIGCAISKLKTKPLVLDYRDAWLLNPSVQISANQKKLQAVEKYILKHSTAILFTTRGMMETYVNHYQLDPKKAFLLRNGFQKGKPIEAPSGLLDPAFHNLVYVGILSTGRDPESLFKAVSQAGAFQGKQIKLNFVGCSQADITYLDQLEKKYNIPVMGIPYVERNKALQYMSAADTLLLLMNDAFKAGSAYGIPGKIGDYIIYNKPILINNGVKEFLNWEFGSDISFTPSPLQGFTNVSFKPEAFDFDGNFNQIIPAIIKS